MSTRRDDARPDEPGQGPKQLEQLLTIDDVAAFLRVDPKTIRRWVSARRIPCLRIGTRLRFERGDIVSWVRQRKEG